MTVTSTLSSHSWILATVTLDSLRRAFFSEDHTSRTDDLYDLHDLYDLFQLHDLDLPGKADRLSILCDLAHVAGWEPYNLHDLARVSWVGLVHYTDAAQQALTTAGEELDDIDHGLSDLSYLSVRGVRTSDRNSQNWAHHGRNIIYSRYHMRNRFPATYFDEGDKSGITKFIRNDRLLVSSAQLSTPNFTLIGNDDFWACHTDFFIKDFDGEFFSYGAVRFLCRTAPHRMISP